MKYKVKITLIAAASTALLTGCSVSTPAMRDELILRELKRQTELLSQINDKLNPDNNEDQNQ